MLITGTSDIITTPNIAVSGNSFYGTLSHSNTATRSYIFPDTAGTVLLNNNFLGHALPTLTSGYLQWTGSAWAFGAGGGGSSSSSYSVTIGDGSSTSIVVTHNLGVSSVEVAIWELSGNYRKLDSGVVITNPSNSTTSITLNFITAPALNSLQVLVFSCVGNTSYTSSSRSVVNGTTASIAPNTAATLNLAVKKGSALYQIQTDYPAWVRVYGSDAERTADSSRLITVDPTPGSGCFLDVSTTTSLTINCSPVPTFDNHDTTPADVAYISVKNLDSVNRAITTTVTYLPLES